jgi:hypothetical protein
VLPGTTSAARMARGRRGISRIFPFTRVAGFPIGEETIYRKLLRAISEIASLGRSELAQS